MFVYNTLSVCKKQRCVREKDNRPVRQLGLGDFCQAQVQGSWSEIKGHRNIREIPCGEGGHGVP